MTDTGCDRLEEPPDGEAGEGADDHPRPEHPTGTAGPDRERRREDAGERERQHDEERRVQQVVRQPLLHPSITGPEHLGQRECHQPDDEASEGRAQLPGEREAPGERDHAVERAGVEEADPTGQQADDGEPQELDRLVEVVAAGDCEQRLVAEDRAEDREGDDRREQARQQRLELEVVPVDDVRGEDRPAERCGEDRPDPRADADRHGDPPVLGREVEDPSEQRTETGADLCRRPLAPPRAPGADRERRGHDLHDHGAKADAARVVVHRVDRRVGAVALGLRGEGEDEEAGGERAEHDDDRDRPGSHVVE